MNIQAHLPPSICVGLDVHKDSIDIATADAGRDGEVRHLGTISQWVVSLKQHFGWQPGCDRVR